MIDQLDKQQQEAFRDWVQYVVAKCYKKGIFSKARTRWKCVLYWNDDRWGQVGIPRSVKERLGETEATQYFQDVAEDILSDKAKLGKALEEYRENMKGFRL